MSICEVTEQSPFLQFAMRVTGAKLTREDFVAQPERFILLTFIPTGEATSPPLETDLRWLTKLTVFMLIIGYFN